MKHDIAPRNLHYFAYNLAMSTTFSCLPPDVVRSVLHTHTRTHTLTHTRAHTHTLTHTYTHIASITHTHTHTPHIHTHTHTHTHTHAHITRHMQLGILFTHLDKPSQLAFFRSCPQVRSPLLSMIRSRSIGCIWAQMLIRGTHG